MDSSDEDDDHDEDDDNHGRAVLQPPSSPDTVFSSTPPKHRRKAARRSESAVVKLSALLHQQQDEVGPPSEGTEPSPVIPDWMDLRIEHSIWVQIFEYAAVHPGQNLIRTQWLLQTALVCRAFLDPALTVLYRCPPLTSDTRLQRLNLLLSTCPSQTRLNYRAKIRSLHIDVTKTHLREGLADPGLLIRNLTNLSEVRLVHPYDEPPYRNLTDHIRFDYPAPLFHALDVAREDDKRRPTRLKSWQWNARMMKQGFVRSLAAVRELHLTPAFAELRTIHFVNYQLPSWERHRKPPAADDSAQIAADEMYARELAGCLAVLGHLEDLTFESSSVVGPPLLDLLPSRLKRVQFTNCWLLDSQDLAAYLTSHGQNLESLTLNHNHSLDLAFLPLLGPTCPNLKELRMNMRYFREHDSWGDAAPNYEHLLLPDQVPKWPPSLQLVDLDSLRRWTPHVAEMFFQSFIDSAPALPMLRHLSLKCMLNIPWRQRSAMRQEWQERLEAIFLRPYEPPEEHYTLRAALAPPPAFGQVAKPKTKKAAATRPSRQSVRIATLQGDSPSRAGAAGKNLRSLGRTLYEEPDSDEFDVEMAEEQDADGGGGGGESEADGSGTGEEPRRSFFVQGLCNVVSLKLDNQKPREQQWQMADFVDSTDDASDPEWPGTEDDEE
ncbi:hypothetical protein SODALDRAFT_275572 [Sodiomyces alkalinus F11]|uniref:Uncharacterized protein n=1 Tax=Sodiomyces alkalinus (strain CBS 110278 / VKM F-3762 / F11) TaxID=1314773 RepID=A0A3N2PXU8_SODAK|nr:hypothetical protein SODALDRAFT_275572 [Sodiomyces alkalinus F11]ROT39351.1 hypothetical protein SODALDRAFT_275572 [Sodiomyces alkalinus F11]